MEAYKREFIQFLEGAGVLKFGDFTAKSGRKIPYFINAGDIKTGEQICKLGEFYAKAYFDKIGNKKTVLYGPAYKGIPIAVSVAVALAKNGLDVPFFFNRKEEKDHGEGGVFVGYKPTAGEEIVIVEDVMAEVGEEFGFPVYSGVDVYDIIEYLEEDEKNRENVERIKNYLKVNGAKE